MKCPKCAYVGFEEADRCRHCGYDFSLVAAPAPVTAAALRVAEPPAPAAYRERGPAAGALGADVAGPLVDLPLTTPPPSAVPPSLFADPQPPPARAPLAVRRTAERPRSRATPHVARRPRPALLDARSEPVDADVGAGGPAAPVAAPAMARVASALVDVALLAAIDLAVVYFTAQMAGVPVAEAAELPLVPLSAFVVGLNVAYLAVFTANGGQTLGKMAMGLRVEATDGALTFGGAMVRVAVAIAGGLAMGAGFIPALWRDDRRAVHDHVAHTRVVKVSA